MQMYYRLRRTEIEIIGGQTLKIVVAEPALRE